MKLHTDNHDFQGIVPSERIPFKIATNAKMFNILSDGIYKDKILAVIRELSCNAFDAHVVSGQTKPFKVQVPTSIEPTFAVIDEGTGIDPSKIADIFWTYGTSSKTDCNLQIGALGLGSKSPFAYTKSSFIVKNRYNGKEHTYFCFINEQGMPDGSEVSVEDTNVHNGITVELAVRREDVYAFKTRIVKFFQHWKTEHRPEFVNGEDIVFPNKPIVFGKDNWYPERSWDNNGSYALMGGILYPIKYSAIPAPSDNLSFITANNFIIEFPIGSLGFQVSREELSYEKTTIQALEVMAEKVVADFRDYIRAEIESGADTPYHLYTNYQKVNEKLNSHGVRIRKGNVFRIIQEVSELYDTVGEVSFTTTKGVSFTTTSLRQPNIATFHEGYSHLNILGVETNGVKKTNGNFRYVLKSLGQVLLGKGGYQVYRSWYRPNIKVTKNEKAPWTKKLTSDLLGEGFSVLKTNFRFNTNVINSKGTNFVLNDKSLTEGTRLYRAYLNSNNHTHSNAYFITAEDKREDHGRLEIETLLKGTILEGCPIVLLSEIDGIVANHVVTPQKTSQELKVEYKTYQFKQEKWCGRYNPSFKYLKTVHTPSTNVSVRQIDKYCISDEENFKGVYLIKNNKKINGEYILEQPLIGMLLEGGLFDEYIHHPLPNSLYEKEMRVYLLSESNVAKLIKKGAQIKSVQDVLKDYFESPDYISRFPLYENLIKHEKELSYIAGLIEDIPSQQFSSIIDGIVSKTSIFKTTIDTINGFQHLLKTNTQLVHDIILTVRVKGCIMGGVEENVNDKESPVYKLLTQYPLIEGMTRTYQRIDGVVESPEHVSEITKDIINYINLKDKNKMNTTSN